jgi:predicted  nucleic acid-binding Zn-ribbon protein
VKAINHVHRDVDTQNQWARAVKGTRNLTNLEVGRVWITLSNQVCKLGTVDAIVLHSQLLELFRLCVDEARPTERLECSESCSNSSEVSQVLEKCRHALMRNNAVIGKLSTENVKLEETQETDDDEYHSDHASGESTTHNFSKQKMPDSSLKSVLSSLELQIGNVQTQLSQHESRLGEIVQRVNSLAQSIPDETTRKQEQADLTSSIEDMTSILYQQHAEQEARYREFQRQTVEVHAQHEDLLGLNVKFQKELSQTHVHFLGHLESLSSKITTVAQTITDISTRSSEMNAAVRVDLESLHRQYDTMQSDMQAKFDGLHSTDAVEEHAKKITELEKSVLEAQKQVKTLNTHTQQEITIVKTRANEIITHIKNLESRLKFPPATPGLKLFPGGSTVDESSNPSVAATVQKTNNPNARS